MNTVRKLPLGRNITAALCTFLTTCLIIIYIQDIAFGAFTTMNALYQPRACLRIVLGIFTVAGEDVRRKGWRDLFRNEDNGIMHPVVLGKELHCGFNFVFVFGTGADGMEHSVNVSKLENMNEGKSYDWWTFAADNFRKPIW